MSLIPLVFFFFISHTTPVWSVDDRKTIPEPQERKLDLFQDVISPSLLAPAKHSLDIPRDIRKIAHKPKEADSVNSVDEVPDSSWFTNRNFFHPMRLEEVLHGPSHEEPPDTGPWTIKGCKEGGFSTGFQIRDRKGDVYIIKLDPEHFPELMSAADPIGSRILYAAGYNVPQNSPVEFNERILIPRNDLKCTRTDGQSFTMNPQGIRRFVEHAGRTKDGRIRAMASKYLAGKPKGPFGYAGVRSDDPNDRIPHQDRRELRGLRLLMAFLNNDDTKDGNTLDTYVHEGGRRYIKHNLIDFGDSLGSSTTRPKEPSQGHKYAFDPPELTKSIVTFSFLRQRKHSVTDPSVGYFEDETFRPETWKPNVPNPAFDAMTDRDGYWAAKIIASFTDAQIAAAVRAGRYSNRKSEDKVIEILKHRRDRIANYWFRRVAPIDRFSFNGNRLAFEDLAVKAKLDAAANVRYRVVIESPNKKPVVAKVGPGLTIFMEPAGRESPVDALITRSAPGWPDLSVRVQVQRVKGIPTIVQVDRSGKTVRSLAHSATEPGPTN